MDCNGYCFCSVFKILLLDLLVVVRLIKITPCIRLENTQPSPTMDEITLVMVDGLMYVAKNELMPSMVKDQIKSSVSMEGVILDATNGSPLNTMEASMHVATNGPNLNTIEKQL